MSKKPTTFSDYDVRVRAYRIWERAGRPEGCAEEHWREALAELEAERQAKEADEQADIPRQSAPASIRNPEDKAA
jgi:hypothetical protein